MTSYQQQENGLADNVEREATQKMKQKAGGYSNEYVLNFAFLSFVVFTTLQFFFALVARSHSMLTDCAAMTVDCVTYLFNFWAERQKHASSSGIVRGDEQHLLSAYERHYRKKLRLLLLELAPPFISVATLAGVTVFALKAAIRILRDTDENHKRAQPDLFLMLLFSGINFVLDGVNVLCFARADQAKGLSEGFEVAMHPDEYVITHEEERQTKSHENQHQHTGNSQPTTTIDEKTHLISPTTPESVDDTTSIEESDEESSNSNANNKKRGLNLNMCSAWTHICADTLRSIVVLIAAGFAYLFPDILSPADADSWGAIVVSVIIIISLFPLIEGLYVTSWELHYLRKGHQQRLEEHTGEVTVLHV